MTPNNNVVSIDKPRCSRCHQFKNEDELNGYDPLAPVGHKYTNAYCRDIFKCKSSESEKLLGEIVSHLKD